MDHSFVRDRTTWMTYLLMGFYGFYLNALGPITPFLKDELGLSYTVSSLHFTAFALGILLVGLAGRGVITRLGRWRALWVGAFGMSLGVVVLVTGRSPLVTIAASFVMGLVGSLILATVPAVLSDQHGDNRSVALSEANVVASLIVTAAPLIVGVAARSSGAWRLALGVVAGVPLVLWMVFARARTAKSFSGGEAATGARERLPLAYWVLWLALMLSIAVEFCMVFWTADFLENTLGLRRANAAQAVSLFLAGMIAGRVLSSRLVRRFPSRRVVIGSLLLAGGGFLVFWIVDSVGTVLGGLFITGLGVASLYPLILSAAIGAAETNTVQATARATLASGTAVLALPLLLGRLADLFGIQRAYGLVGILLAGVLLIILLTGRVARRPAVHKKGPG